MLPPRDKWLRQLPAALLVACLHCVPCRVLPRQVGVIVWPPTLAVGDILKAAHPAAFRLIVPLLLAPLAMPLVDPHWMALTWPLIQLQVRRLLSILKVLSHRTAVHRLPTLGLRFPVRQMVVCTVDAVLRAISMFLVPALPHCGPTPFGSPCADMFLLAQATLGIFSVLLRPKPASLTSGLRLPVSFPCHFRFPKFISKNARAVPILVS